MSLCISFTGKDGKKNEVTFEKLSKDTPILEALETKSIQIPYGCREGVCGSCLVRVKSGAELLDEIRPLEEDTLSRVEEPAQKRLSCRACVKEGASGKIELSSGWEA